MPMSINTDLLSMSVQRNLFNNNRSLNTIMQRLSTGCRINSAKDDAANLSLSKKLSSHTSGLNAGNNNIKTALSKLYTYEGYMNGIAESLQKARDLAVQAADGVYSDNERKMLNLSSQEIAKEVNFAAQGANSEINKNRTNYILDPQKPPSIIEAAAITDGYTIIKNASDLITTINADLSGKYILMSDIDMSELGTLNDSAITGTFTGEFNGNGYNINNLTIDTGGAATDYIGLFSEASNAEFKNVSIKNTNISATNSNYVGGLIGNNWNTNIDNVNVSGSIKGVDRIGGIIGRNRNSTISNSSSSVSCSGNAYIGGLAGLNYENATIENCYAIGNVTGTTMVGGLTGSNSMSSKVKYSYSTGNISGNSRTGGLVGSNYTGHIENSYSTSTVTGNDRTGGFVGSNNNNSNIINSYSTGYVDGDNFTGGFTGTNDNSSIQNCYSTTNIEAEGWTIGGFTGSNLNNASIDSCYSTGNVAGGSPAGGFVGRNQSGATISNSFTKSKTLGGITLNGFAGNITGGTIDSTNSYDNNLSTDLSGAVNGPSISKANWDNNIWDTSLGEPQLRWDQEYNTFSVQVGAESSANSRYNAKNLKLNFDALENLDLSSVAGAREAIQFIDNTLTYLNDKRSQVGSNILSLESQLSRNTDRRLALLQSKSDISDADIALESARLAKHRILQQAGTSLLQQTKGLNSNIMLTLLNNL